MRTLQVLIGIRKRNLLPLRKKGRRLGFILGSYLFVLCLNQKEDAPIGASSF